MTGKKYEVPWSPEEDARLEQMWGKGATAAAIAAVLKRTTGATEARIVVLRKKGVALAGRTDPDNRKKHPLEDKILDAWIDGDSASVIAARHEGCSRSVVSGVVTRARKHGDPRAIERDRKPVVRTPRKARKATRKSGPWEQTAAAPKPPKAEPVPKTPPPSEVPSLGIPLADLAPGQCKFATTAHDVPPADHRFCGQPTHMGRVYCPHHASIAYDGFHGDTKGPSAEVMALAFANRRHDASARKLIRQWGHKFATPANEAVDA